uniref:BAG domain-containing protein n=1 Tax=Elaeophora elaphi TaxID=1147741 RepID=A0A0R3RYI9_9BILA
MEEATNSVRPNEHGIKKMNRTAFNRKISKIDKLVKLYKQLREAITNLENREVSFGEDYDEQYEESCNKRLLKLIQRRLQIHNYLVRKGIFVSDTGEAILPDVKPKLMITSTGIEDLNVLLTEYVNQETDSEVLGCKIRIPYKHVTVDDVKMLVDKLKETNNTQLFPDDPEEFDQLVQNIACEVNKLVKRLIENNHRMGLADWAVPDQASEVGNFPSTSANADVEDKEEHSSSVPTWDIANVELHKACGRGELDCTESENSNNIDDTEMSPVADEEGFESDTQYSANGDMENKNNESDDSCCIVEERMYKQCEGSGDSDCCIIEDDETAISEEIVSEDTENIEAQSANDDAGNADNPSENGKKDMELDEKIVDDDDDCCIIED